MPNQIDITPFNLKYRKSLISLLQSEGLPVEDLPDYLSNFYMATDNGLVIGAIGLETYDGSGLLRSLIVKPEYRGMKVAASLVNAIEKLAKQLGINVIYLLTETAQGYFSKNGYRQIERTEAPASIKQSSEFSHVCPSTAALMKKAL